MESNNIEENSNSGDTNNLILKQQNLLTNNKVGYKRLKYI